MVLKVLSSGIEANGSAYSPMHGVTLVRVDCVGLVFVSDDQSLEGIVWIGLQKGYKTISKNYRYKFKNWVLNRKKFNKSAVVYY